MFFVWLSAVSPGSTKGEAMVGGTLHPEVRSYQLDAGDAKGVTSFSLRFGFIATRGSVEEVREY